MIINYPQKIRTNVCALLLCLSPFSFADSASYYTAEQYQKLLDAKVVIEQPVHKIDAAFLSAFKKLKISSSEQLEFLLTAFTSPIYKASPSQKFLSALYHSISYGSFTQATLHNNLNWDFERSSILSFLGNYPAYYILTLLDKKPELREFLYATHNNGGLPVLYNPPHSQFLSSIVSKYDEDYWENLGDEALHGLLWLLSCNNNGEELHNKISFMQNCKTDKHDGYPELKNLKFDQPEYLEVKANFEEPINKKTDESEKDAKAPSRMQLTPVPGYFKNLSDQEDYSLKSLQHLMTKIVEDRTEGAQFFVLYRGIDKFQFFTVGIYQGFLSLTYVVNHHAPTPTLNYLIPLKGMDLDLLVSGIHSMLHQDKSDHSMVPDLQGVWMISSQ